MMTRVWLFGDDVNTDEIIPGRYNVTTDPEELAKYVLCEIRPEFPKEVNKGDILVGGRNFGCGSSREHAPIAIKAAGVKYVIAKSFARIFYRNAINIGLAVLECPELNNIDDGESITVNPNTGLILSSKNEKFKANSIPDFILQIINSGGIIKFLQEKELADLQI